eukprot:TRINITY_DN2112_c0_g1_i1.p1 TRINITY_DN2112_c0_g1~~TRINITY_DN2112_c0_g1_i1.p1  ORF type:complete len:940 (-),score=175.17 TRINITY_DN2112_c0_g1_i1:114-2885(-)
MGLKQLVLQHLEQLLGGALLLDLSCCVLLYLLCAEVEWALAGVLVRVGAIGAVYHLGSTRGRSVEPIERLMKDLVIDIFDEIKPGKPDDNPAQRKAEWWKNGLDASVFLVLTACQITLGIQLVSLTPHSSSTLTSPTTLWSMTALARVLLGITIALCNAELALVQAKLQVFIQREGVLVPEVHPRHPLHLRERSRWNSVNHCEKCGIELYGKHFDCEQCLVFVCLRCARDGWKRQRKQKLDQDDSTPRSSDPGRSNKKDSDSDSNKTANGGKTRSGLRDSAPSRQYMDQIWRRLVQPYMWLLVGALLSNVSMNIVSMMLPQYSRSVLDTIQLASPAKSDPSNNNNSSNSNSNDALQQLHSDPNLFYSTVLAMVVTQVAMQVASGLYSVLYDAVKERLRSGLDEQIFARMLLKPLAYYDITSARNVESRLTGDVASILQLMDLATSYMNSAMTLFGAAVMCLTLSWQLSVLAITVLWPISTMAYTISSMIRKSSSETFRLSHMMSTIRNQCFNHMRTVRAFGREPAQLQKYRSLIEEQIRAEIGNDYTLSVSRALSSLADLALQVVVLTYGGRAILSGSTELTLGSLVTFQTYWNMLSDCLRGAFQDSGSVTQTARASKRVFELLDSPVEIDPTAGAPITQVGDIEISNVSFRYTSRPTKVVLKNISLTIPRGSVVALVGRSGGGKSTLVNMLIRFYDPETGEIKVNGRNLKDVCLDDYRKLYGIVQQDSQLFDLTIEQNIAFGVDNYTQEELITAAKKANCYDFIMAMDDGFATKLNDNGATISGGQKQRIALARVLIKKPQLLLLDEATSALDNESEQAVQETIDAMIKEGDVTVVLVAHRLSTVIGADKICVIDQGQVAESGTHAELLKAKGIYSQLVQRQVDRLVDTMHENVEDAARANSTIDELFAEHTDHQDEVLLSE